MEAKEIFAVGTLDNLFACTGFCIRPAYQAKCDLLGFEHDYSAWVFENGEYYVMIG